MMLVNKYSKEEKMACVEEFRASGMSINAYAKEKEIPKSTFRGWLKLDKAIEFGEINLRETFIEQASNPIYAMKETTVFINEYIRIELKKGYNKELLKNIVGGLINAD